MNKTPQPAPDNVVAPVYYVENVSGMIYEVQFLPDAVLVRPATPVLYGFLRRVDNNVFLSEFTEAVCSHDDIKKYIAGGGTGLGN